MWPGDLESRSTKCSGNMLNSSRNRYTKFGGAMHRRFSAIYKKKLTGGAYVHGI